MAREAARAAIRGILSPFPRASSYLNSRLPFQIFQDASNSNSSNPTSQSVAFPNFQDASNSKSSTFTSQNVAFANLPRYLKQQNLKNLHPKMLPFQIFQDASNSRSSKPTSQNVAFSNLPTCQKQQKLKTYIPKCCLSKSSNMPTTAKAQNLHPKMVLFQIFQHAKISKSSKPTSQNVAFPNLPTRLKQ